MQEEVEVGGVVMEEVFSVEEQVGHVLGENQVVQGEVDLSLV
jgi:hypothetical protein